MKTRFCVGCKGWHDISLTECPHCGRPKHAYNVHLKESYLNRHLEMQAAGVPYDGPKNVG